MQTDLPETHVTMNEAIRITSLSRMSLYRAIARGALRVRKIGVKRIAFTASDLQAFLTSADKPAAAPVASVAAVPAGRKRARRAA